MARLRLSILLVLLISIACNAELHNGRQQQQDARHKRWRRNDASGATLSSPATGSEEQLQKVQLELGRRATPVTVSMGRRASSTSSSKTSTTTRVTVANTRGVVGAVTTTTSTRPTTTSTIPRSSTTSPSSRSTTTTSTRSSSTTSTTSSRPTTTSSTTTRPSSTSSTSKISSITSKTTSKPATTSTTPLRTSSTTTRPISISSATSRAEFTTPRSTATTGSSTLRNTASTPTTTKPSASSAVSSTSRTSVTTTPQTTSSRTATTTTHSSSISTTARTTSTTLPPFPVTSTTSTRLSTTTPFTSSTLSTAPLPTTVIAPVTTSATCAPPYVGGQSTISGTGTLPKPTAFVKRNGRQLQLSNKPFRPVGPNMYWLGLDENVSPMAYPSKARIREAMAIAVAMGANTIRALSLGVSLGNPLSVSPKLGVYNEAAFDIVDYTLFTAREYGLRVIMTMCDEYNYYHGGKYTFLNWLGTNTTNWGREFYTNTTVISAFEGYIKQYVTRYNKYSQTYYYNDPTVLAWETGNEYGGYIGKYGYPPLSFTNEIARHIKSLAPNHLVIDGTDGFWNYTTREIAPGVNSSYVDIMSDHLYPLNNPLMAKEQEIVTQYNKGFLIGEFDWTDGLYGGSTSLANFFSAVEATDYIGDVLWNVMGHDDQCCRYVVHNDGYSLYYPNGNPSQTTQMLQVVQHWYRMSGRTPPTTLPGVACPQPVF